MSKNKSQNAQIASNLIEAFDNLGQVHDELTVSDVRRIGQMLYEAFNDDCIELLDTIEILVSLAKGRKVCFVCGSFIHARSCQCGKDAEIIDVVG